LQSATIFSIRGGGADFFSVMARADYGESTAPSQGTAKTLVARLLHLFRTAGLLDLMAGMDVW
jgi:hypothetical protein